MQLYNHNAKRAYPFRDDAVFSGTVNGVAYTVPLDFLVEARFAFTQPVPAGAVRLVSMRLTATEAWLTFDVAGLPVELAAGLAVPDPGTYWVARGFDTDSGASWLLVFGHGAAEALAALDAHPFTFDFPPQLLPVLARDISGSRLTSLRDDSGSEIAGDVVLEEGYNCRITVDSNRVDMAVAIGDGAGKDCAGSSAIGCSGALFRINGVNAKNLSLNAGNGVRIVPLPSEHAIDISAIPEDEC